jgi:Neprosin
MRKIGLCFGALLATAGCSGNHPSAPASTTGDAPTAPAAAATGSGVTVRQFLDARYRAQDVRHSFHTALGQDIDCIDFFAQPGVRALAARGQPITSIPKLPDVPEGFRAGEPSAPADPLPPGVLFDGSIDSNGDARSCPEGTVPEVRISAEQVERAGGVDGFRKAVHTKVAPAKPVKGGPDEYGDCNGEDYPGYAHVYGQLLTPFNQTITAGSSIMSIYGPNIPDPAAAYGHSIAQTWMVGYTADYSNAQTVETGWNVDSWVYDGDTHVPHLFIFSTVDDYVTTGCYNDWDAAITGYEYDDAGALEVDDAGNPLPGTCVPWIQLSRQYTPGMALPASVVQAVNPHKASTLPNELSLSTVQIAGGWWILVQVSGGAPAVLGFYPGKSYFGAMSSYQIGGEVAASSPIGADGGAENVDPFEAFAVQMGSGQKPSEGQGYAAYHRNYGALVSGPTEGGSPLVDDALICGTDDADYAYSATPKPVSQASGPWVNYFYFGGTPPALGTSSSQ